MVDFGEALLHDEDVLDLPKDKSLEIAAFCPVVISKMDPVQNNDQIVFSPPLSLEPKSRDAGESEKQRGVLARLIDLLKTVRLGSDITRFQVPVQLNMPKSQLQIYGESVYCCGQDLLSRCAEGHDSLQRFIRVVAWHISTTRPPPFAQAPFNPILGETHHVTAGNLNVLLEQVSHHPPVSALYATNEASNIRLQWWHNACPRFLGNSVEVTVQGERTLWLDSHGEGYQTTCPKLLIRFFPVLGTEWVGSTKVVCDASGLEATVVFKGKPFFGLGGTEGQVLGNIRDASSNQVLYELEGGWNKVVTMKEVKTGETSVLYDAQAMLTNLRAPAVRGAREEGAPEPEATESVVVWGRVMRRMVRREWEEARQAKHSVEESQRAAAKRRKEASEAWIPKHFVQAPPPTQQQQQQQQQQDEGGIGGGGGGWRWRHQGHAVPPAALLLS